MARVERRDTAKGERRWRAVVRRKGQPTLSATFTTERDAERWALVQEGKIAEAKNLPDLEGERHTVAELLNRWELDITPKRRKAVAAHIEWWRKAIGDRRLSDVTAALLREKRDQLGRETFTRAVPRKAVTLTRRRVREENPEKPKPAPKVMKRTPATVNRYFETIATALHIAEREYEWLRESPARKVRDLTEPKGRVRFLSNDERDALLKAAKNERDELHALVTVALCTGARAGELLALRWPDVDLNRGLATLHETKNGERRAIALAGPAKRLLDERSKVRRIDTDLVFPDPEHDKAGKARAYDYAKDFRAATAKAGIENFRFHDLRHTAASYLAMNGATTAEIAAVLGHKTLAMVKRYSHLTEQHVSSVVSRMTTSVFGIA